jgi:hypothetical protein
MATQAGDHTSSCRMDLTTSEAAVALARAYVRRQLASWEIADRPVNDAVGCVSELVTLTLARSAGLPRVELFDGHEYVMVAVSSLGPSVGRPPTDPEDLGLVLLTEVADDWDDYTDEDGRVGTWCMLIV